MLGFSYAFNHETGVASSKAYNSQLYTIQLLNSTFYVLVASDSRWSSENLICKNIYAVQSLVNTCATKVFSLSITRRENFS